MTPRRGAGLLESRRDESQRDRAPDNAQSLQECVRLTLNDVLAHWGKQLLCQWHSARRQWDQAQLKERQLTMINHVLASINAAPIR